MNIPRVEINIKSDEVFELHIDGHDARWLAHQLLHAADGDDMPLDDQHLIIAVKGHVTVAQPQQDNQS